MNEGDYIRYKIQNKYEDIVKIGKISFIGVEEIPQYNREPRGELYCQVDNELRNLYAEDIIKLAEGTPKGLLSLIEAGDYVNGRIVDWVGNNFVAFGKLDYAYEKDIKSIVTKEQFESMEYKVGDK